MTTTSTRPAGTASFPWLPLIVAVGLIVRVAALLLYPHTPESDELGYMAMARNLVGGRGLVDIAGNLAMYNMGYPTFVLAPLVYLFGDTLTAIHAANALLGGVAIALVYALAREAGAGKPGARLAAAMWALYLPAGLYPVYVLKENLMIPLMLGVLWCVLRLAGKARAPVLLGCGLLFGLLALTGNAALALGAPLAAALVLFSGARLRGLPALALVIVTAALVAAPWMLRNQQLLGAPVLNTNGGFNLYLGNNALATGMFMSIDETPRAASWPALRATGEVKASEALKHDALAWIGAHPAQFATLAVKKLVLFWTPPVHAGKDAPSTLETLVRIGWAIQFFVLVAAALGGQLSPALRHRRTVLLWLALAAYTGVHMLFYVIFRYREPIMPVLCVLAALGVEKWFVALGRRRRAVTGSADENQAIVH